MGQDLRHKYTDNEATNTSLGQIGSVFTDNTGADITPPDGTVFIAITMVGETTAFTTLTPEGGAGVRYISTGTASDSGTGGTVLDSGNEFAQGVTIFGRWSTIRIAAGSIIAYVG